MIKPTRHNVRWETLLSRQAFSWASFRIVLTAQHDLQLPDYKGSTLRGGFGHALRRICCSEKQTNCEGCRVVRNCPYAYVFETPKAMHQEIPHQTSNLPHPFIIEPPLVRQTVFGPGDELSFGLVLIGKSVSFLPYIIFALDQMARKGLGKNRGQFILRAVRAVDSLRPDSAIRIFDQHSQRLDGDFKPSTFADILSGRHAAGVNKIRLNFCTPTRIVHNSRIVDSFTFDILMRAVLRRVSLLGRIHCNSEWDLPFSEMIRDAAEMVMVEKSKLEWVDWERYSNRQRSKMKLGGFTGSVLLSGDITPFMPLLRLAAILHVGKNTSFGLGKYEMTKAEM